MPTNTRLIHKSRILGTGSYLPKAVLTNADLEKLVETSDQWIVERTGIRQRHMAADNEVTSDLGLHAAKAAIEAAGLTAADIDLIIFATVTPDQIMPATACILQRKLGCRNIMAFDLSAACSGFLYSLTVADQFVQSGMVRNVLCVGAEVLHRVVDYKERETCILFGDAAGAFVIGRASGDQSSELIGAHMHADGTLSDLLVMAAGGSAMPFSQAVLDGRHHYVKMKGREIYKHAVRSMVQCCEEALQASGLQRTDVDWVIPHQANLRIIEAVAGHFDLPMERVIVNLADTGNTSAATIPVAIDQSIRQGKIKRGQTLLLTAFGAGLTSGSILLRY